MQRKTENIMSIPTITNHIHPYGRTRNFQIKTAFQIYQINQRKGYKDPYIHLKKSLKSKEKNKVFKLSSSQSYPDPCFKPKTFHDFKKQLHSKLKYQNYRKKTFSEIIPM